ncbi:hypothetical protein JCM5353_001237 [Sporobolomyces roseus]
MSGHSSTPASSSSLVKKSKKTLKSDTSTYKGGEASYNKSIGTQGKENLYQIDSVVGNSKWKGKGRSTEQETEVEESRLNGNGSRAKIQEIESSRMKREDDVQHDQRIATSSTKTRLPRFHRTLGSFHKIVLRNSTPIPDDTTPETLDEGLDPSISDQLVNLQEYYARTLPDNPTLKDNPVYFVFRWSSSGSIESSLEDYLGRCTLQSRAIVNALAEADRTLFDDLTSRPIAASFKSITGTSNPLEWRGGPHILPRSYHAYEVVRAIRLRQIPLIIIFGPAGLTTDRKHLESLLRLADPDLILAYTFENGSVVLPLTARRILDGLQNGAQQDEELQYFFDQLDAQHQLRLSIKQAYADNPRGVAGRQRVPSRADIGTVKIGLKRKSEEAQELDIFGKKPYAGPIGAGRVGSRLYNHVNGISNDAAASTSTRNETSRSRDGHLRGTEQCMDCGVNLNINGIGKCVSCMNDEEHATYKDIRPKCSEIGCTKLVQRLGKCSSHLESQEKAQFVKDKRRYCTYVDEDTQVRCTKTIAKFRLCVGHMSNEQKEEHRAANLASKKKSMAAKLAKESG